MPFNIANTGVNVQDAEVLAQILSIEIGNAGKYVILPRTTAIQTAMRELEYQMSGATAEEEAKALGRAINAEFVLSAEVRSLGTTNMFTVSILHVEDGSLLAGGYRNYRAIADGIRLMAELAGMLTSGESGGTPSVAQGARPDSARTPREPKVVDPETDKAARLNTIGVSVGTSFADPLIIATVRGTFAPGRNWFLEAGCDLGVVSIYNDVQGYYSAYPFVHTGFFMPFKGKGGWYAGAGGGFMLGEYTFAGGKVPVSVFAADIIAGVNIGNFLDISYTLRTNFGSASNKVAVGYTYRFK